MRIKVNGVQTYTLECITTIMKVDRVWWWRRPEQSEGRDVQRGAELKPNVDDFSLKMKAGGTESQMRMPRKEQAGNLRTEGELCKEIWKKKKTKNTDRYYCNDAMNYNYINCCTKLAINYNMKSKNLPQNKQFSIY